LKPRAGQLRQPWLVASALFAGAALWFTPLATQRGSILIWPGARYSDLLTSHWANAAYIHRMLLAWHTLPLWNESILSGLPLAADPLSGIWYPPNWLAVLLPSSWTFYALLAAHLAWGGAGIYHLLRQLGKQPLASLLGGIAFLGLPGLIGHMALGHFSLVCAVAWTPWMLHEARKSMIALASGRPGWGSLAARAGIVWGLIFLIDPRWLIPAGLLMAGYAIYTVTRQAHSSPGASNGRLMARAGGGALLAGGAAFGIAAVLALPLVELTKASTRALLTPGEAQGISLPWASLLQLVTPVFGAWPETILYSGVVVLLLASAALALGERETRFWGASAVCSLVLALGGQTPLYGWTAKVVPGMGMLRVPARFALLVGLCLCILAGIGADRLARRLDRPQPNAAFNLMIAGLVVAGLLLAASLAFSAPAGLLWRYGVWSGLVVAAAVWAYLGNLGRANGARLLGGLLVLLLFDLALVNFTLIAVRPGPAADSTMAARVQAASEMAAGGRIFSPSYSLEQPLAAIDGLRLADGIDPLQLLTYWNFMAQVVDFPPQGYSVTMPPYPGGNPAEPWRPELDPGRLGLFDISLVVSTYPLNQPLLDLYDVRYGAYFYRNPSARGEAWLQDAPGVPSGAWQTVGVEQVTPNRLQVHIAGPGRLVFSEVVYPGWVAVLDGQVVKLETERGLLRAVQLPPGQHLVALVYRPISLIVGGLITLLTVSLWLVWGRRA
jgi:hypothetical protein